MSQPQLIPKPPNKRRSTPRSKTGCVTCKIRRLKCGEEKPSCIRCLKSGWQCDGYEHAANLTAPSRNRSGSSLSNLYPRTPSSSISRSPSPHGSPSAALVMPDVLLLSQQERRYFQHFINEMPFLFQEYESFFWKSMALQESTTNPIVRHSIVALGALLESTLKSKTGHYRMDVPQGLHREFALQQYQKAISGLRESISITADGEEKGTCTTLVSCLVLAFFDNFIGNVGFALHHTSHARKILPVSKLIVKRPLPLEVPPDFQDLLSCMFLRLDMHALFAMGIPKDRSYITMEPYIPNMPFPPRFTSLEQARNAKDTIIWEGYNFCYQVACFQFSPQNKIPASAFQIRNFFFERVQTIQLLLDEFTIGSAPDPTVHPMLRPDTLKLFTVALQIRLTAALGGSELEFDKLLPQFRYLVGVCRQIMQFDMLADPSILANESFVFQPRIISPLLLVATKCRDPSLRREAISLLLESHRREWMYDSLLCGKLASWIMEMEEEVSKVGGRRENSWDVGNGGWEYNKWVAGIGEGNSLGRVDSGLDERDTKDGREAIREENRCWGECVEWGLEGRRARVRCRQGIKGVEGAWRWREREICW